MSGIDTNSATLLAAFISAVIGSVIGPFILRRLRRNDVALDARREWAKEKLMMVFSEGPQMSTDSVDYTLNGLLSDNPWALTHQDMHAINPSLAESLDLRLIQPHRSALLQKWLEGWFWELWNERENLVVATHNSPLPPSQIDAELERRAKRYARTIRRVEVALTRWSLGVRPSIFFWLSVYVRQPLRRRRADRSR